MNAKVLESRCSRAGAPF